MLIACYLHCMQFGFLVLSCPPNHNYTILQNNSFSFNTSQVGVWISRTPNLLRCDLKTICPNNFVNMLVTCFLVQFHHSKFAHGLCDNATQCVQYVRDTLNSLRYIWMLDCHSTILQVHGDKHVSLKASVLAK